MLGREASNHKGELTTCRGEPGPGDAVGAETSIRQYLLTEIPAGHLPAGRDAPRSARFGACGKDLPGRPTLEVHDAGPPRLARLTTRGDGQTQILTQPVVVGRRRFSLPGTQSAIVGVREERLQVGELILSAPNQQ